VLTLALCWAWFLALWSEAALNWSLGDLQWWLLVLGALAGVYGLRPNLERAIDSAWLGKSTNQNALAERAAQLRPVKRTIDIIFTLAMLAVVVAALAIWGIGTQRGPSTGGS
jgi:hypothetical protein